MSLVLSLVSLFSLSTTAFAAESTENLNLYSNDKQAEEIALLHAPRPTQQMLDNSGLYTKVHLSSEPLIENGEQVGTVETYVYVLPSFMKSSTGYEYSVYQSEKAFYKQDTGRVYLTGYFMYNYDIVNCYDVSVTSSHVTGFQPNSPQKIGNRTKKVKVTVDFTYRAGPGAITPMKDSISLSCTNDGTPTIESPQK